MLNLDLSIAKNTSVGKKFFDLNDSGYEPEILELISKLMLSKIDDTLFINVGSNIGIFPLFVAKLARINNLKIDIHAHEPFSEIRDIAFRLMHINDLNYHLDEYAITNFNGETDFYISKNSDSSCSIIEGFRTHKNVLRINTRTLDSLYFDTIKQKEYGKVIILVDVESAEPQVLQGAIKLMNEIRPIVICEVLAGRTESQLEDIFTTANYKYYNFNNGNWMNSNKIVGDMSYTYKDWLFLPKETDINEYIKE